MKNSFLKKIGAVLGIAMIAAASYGATVSFHATAAQTNSMFTGAGNIQSITLTGGAVSDASGNNYTLYLYDAPALSLTNVFVKATNYTATVYTNTVTYTDILGNVVSNSYLYITNIASVNTNAGSTVNFIETYRLIGTWSAPSNGTVIIPYSSANPFVNGLMVSNAAPGTISVQFQPWR